MNEAILGSAAAAGIAAASVIGSGARVRWRRFDVRVVVDRRPRLVVAALGSCAFAVGALGLLGALAVIAVVTVGVAIAGRTRRAKLLDETRAAMVDLCRAMAAELRAGQPLAGAFTAAARGAPLSVAEALRPAVAVSRRGDAADLAEVLRAAARAPGCAGLRSIAACWQVATSSGSTLAPAIDRVGDALQDDIDLRRDVGSLLAGPRTTMRLLAVLPAVGLLLGTAIGARPLSFLVSSPAGWGCLIGALLFDAAGIGWSRRIAARAARVG